MENKKTKTSEKKPNIFDYVVRLGNPVDTRIPIKVTSS